MTLTKLTNKKEQALDLLRSTPDTWHTTADICKKIDVTRSFINLIKTYLQDNGITVEKFKKLLYFSYKIHNKLTKKEEETKHKPKRAPKYGQLVLDFLKKNPNQWLNYYQTIPQILPETASLQYLKNSLCKRLKTYLINNRVIFSHANVNGYKLFCQYVPKRVQQHNIDFLTNDTNKLYSSTDLKHKYNIELKDLENIHKELESKGVRVIETYNTEYKEYFYDY